MKYRKTPAKLRGEYTYHFSDGTKSTIFPGLDGVTEENIKRLHAFDDREVYSNIKNDRPSKKDGAWNLSLDYITDEEPEKHIRTEYLKGAGINPEYLFNDWQDLYEVINKLTPKQKEVIDYIFFRGYSLSDTRKALGTSPANIKQILNRAFRNIRRDYNF